MNALFLTRYSRRGSTSRLRALQYIPSLEAAGWHVTVEPLLADSYLERLYRNASRSARELAGAALRRLSLLCGAAFRRFDVVYVQADLMPGLPFTLERHFYRRGPRIVVDYDDALFVPYDRWLVTRNKVHRIMRSATEVIVANRYLFDYARQRNHRTTLIPTVIDTDRYLPRDGYAFNGLPVVGWIGTPITARYLASVSSVLRQVARRHQFVLRSVGACVSIPGLQIECLPWSEATEASLIRSFDIGIMPLTDEPFAYGKSGFKLIQYMGCAVPSVASAIGANRDILAAGGGLLASTPAEFHDALSALLVDQSLRERLGKAGRARARSAYSLRANQAKFREVLCRAAATT